MKIKKFVLPNGLKKYHLLRHENVCEDFAHLGILVQMINVGSLQVLKQWYAHCTIISS